MNVEVCRPRHRKRRRCDREAANRDLQFRTVRGTLSDFRQQGELQGLMGHWASVSFGLGEAGEVRNVYAVVGRAPYIGIIASVCIKSRSFIGTRVFPLPHMSRGCAVGDSRETTSVICVNTGDVMLYLCVRRDAPLTR